MSEAADVRLSMVPRSEKVFVGNLPKGIKDEELRAHFEVVGPLEDCFAIKDKTSGTTVGYGFLTFVNVEDAQACINKFHQSTLVNPRQPRDKRTIRVNWAAGKKPAADDTRDRTISTTSLGFQQRRGQGGRGGSTAAEGGAGRGGGYAQGGYGGAPNFIKEGQQPGTDGGPPQAGSNGPQPLESIQINNTGQYEDPSLQLEGNANGPPHANFGGPPPPANNWGQAPPTNYGRPPPPHAGPRGRAGFGGPPGNNAPPQHRAPPNGAPAEPPVKALPGLPGGYDQAAADAAAEAGYDEDDIAAAAFGCAGSGAPVQVVNYGQIEKEKEERAAAEAAAAAAAAAVPEYGHQPPYGAPPPGYYQQPAAGYDQANGYQGQPPADYTNYGGYGQTDQSYDPWYGAQPAGDQAYAMQPPGAQPYGNQPPVDQAYGNQPPVDQSYGNQPTVDQAYGNQPPVDQAYGNQPTVDQAYGNQASNQWYGNQPPIDQSYGNQPPVDQSYGNQPPVNQSYGNQPPVNQSYGNQPPVDQSYGNQPPVDQSYGNQQAGAQPYEQQPAGPVVQNYADFSELRPKGPQVSADYGYGGTGHAW